MQLPTSKIIHSFLFVLSICLLSAALLFEYMKDLTPCPLCISQRIVICIIGLLSLFVIVRKLRASTLRFFGLLVFLFSVIGIALASRQLYLEQLPLSDHTVCMPGFSYLLQVLPLQGILHSLFFGGSECGAVKWEFLGLSMAGWLLIVFIITLITGLLEMIRKPDSYLL